MKEEWKGEMKGNSKTTICFRNDDVNTLTPELLSLTEILLRRKLPITHAVEPGNLTDETANWLLALKKEHEGLVEIVQHGWNHTLHLKGEFDASRSYMEQLEDLKKGKERLQSIFQEGFFPMLVFPFGVYTGDTIKAASRLRFKVLSGTIDYRISRRVLSHIGRFLRKGLLWGHKVSHHLRYYPGTQMFVIGTSIFFIRKYLDPFSNKCIMYSPEEILSMFDRSRKFTSVVVFLFHHRFHEEKGHLELVERVVDALLARNDVGFANYEEVYRELVESKTPLL